MYNNTQIGKKNTSFTFILSTVDVNMIGSIFPYSVQVSDPKQLVVL